MIIVTRRREVFFSYISPRSSSSSFTFCAKYYYTGTRTEISGRPTSSSDQGSTVAGFTERKHRNSWSTRARIPPNYLALGGEFTGIICIHSTTNKRKLRRDFLFNNLSGFTNFYILLLNPEANWIRTSATSYAQVSAHTSSNNTDQAR